MLRSFVIAAARAGQRQRQSSSRNFSTPAAAAGGVLARRAALVFFPSAIGVYATVYDERSKRVAFTISVLPLRLLRDVIGGAATVIDYKWSLRGLEGGAREAAKAACHQRGADRLLEVCKANGGIYIKLGQHLGMLDYLLPSPYVVTMRAHLLDKCPVSTWDSVRDTIIEDLGAPPEELFSQIDPVPVASASLAQVHVATDAKTGKKVAVKVQHRGLRETSAVDLATIELVVKAARALAGVDYMWLVEECEANLPCELDFMQEAANSERCAQNLADPRSKTKGRVYVPWIDRSKTSHRVLTMEFIDGVKVVDREGLARIGARPAAVARLLAETFNEMIFVFGDVHADPHASNVFVRKAPPGKGTWQLVLLDHGLYRRLDDGFRLEYAALWRALIFADVARIEESARRMNAGGVVPLFAGMLTQRPWREVSKRAGGAERLRLKGTEAERGEIQMYGARYARQIGELLGQIPREMLLLLKTNDCLRAVDAELGAGSIGTYVITARECARALAAKRTAEVPGWRSAAVSAVERVKLEARLGALQAVAAVAAMRNAVFGAPPEAVVDDDDEEQQLLAQMKSA